MNSNDHQVHKSNRALTILVTALNECKVPGASLLSTILNERRFASIEKAISQLKATVEEQRDSYSLCGPSDDVLELLQLSLDTIARTIREEKINVAVRILENTLLLPSNDRKLDYVRLEHFLRCTDSLSVAAIQLLLVINRVASVSDYEGRDLSVQKLAADAELEISAVRNLIGELTAWGMLRYPTIGLHNLGLTDTIPDRIILTDEGGEYAAFVEGSSNNASGKGKGKGVDS